MDSNFFFLILIPIIAFLYASVGHGGASGYLALMALFGFSQNVMKPSALVLNCFVSAIAFIQYHKQGHFKWKLLLPFILLSIPLSFYAAKYIHIDTKTYKLILAGCLIVATTRILGFSGKSSDEEIKEIKFIPALFIGGFLGLLSGMIGIGGGILLSPVLLLLHWANMKQTAAVSAAFIFLNSMSGLTGASLSTYSFTSEIYLWAGLAIFGGIVGSWYGSKKFTPLVLKYVLSLVLLSACIKLVI